MRLASLGPATKCFGTALAAVVCIMSAPTTARADMIYVGGYGFQENAFATSVQSMYHSNTFDGGFVFGPLFGGISPSSPSTAVVGPYIGDFAGSFDPVSYLQLGFTGGIRNGPGPDLALFESGIVMDRFAFSLTPSTSALAYTNYSTTFTGTYFGAEVPTNRVNVALVDLSSFGVAEGARLESVTIGLYLETDGARPSLTAAGSFYADPVSPVPAPGGIMLVVAGVPFLLGYSRRRWKRARGEGDRCCGHVGDGG